jgi:hypothetical protein
VFRVYVVSEVEVEILRRVGLRAARYGEQALLRMTNRGSRIRLCELDCKSGGEPLHSKRISLLERLERNWILLVLGLGR